MMSEDKRMESESEVDVRVGTRIRQAREARGESLRAFADRCGVSSSMISNVERGVKSPTLGILLAIAEGLEIPLSRLVSNEHSLADGPKLIRAADIVEVADLHGGVQRFHLSPTTIESRVEFVRYVMPPDTTIGGFAGHAHGTIEHVYVTSGRIQIIVGEKVLTLEKGDAVSYNASVQHTVRAISDTTTEIYFVIERS